MLCALLGVLAYIGVHEAGHALAAISTGRTVTKIRMLSLTPHVALRGPSTPASDAFAASAGSGLVVALWFAYTAIYRNRRSTLLCEGFTFFAAIELLAWFVSALVHTTAPPNNDVTKFINVSGLSPASVAFAVAAIALAAAQVKFSCIRFSKAEPAPLSC